MKLSVCFQGWVNVDIEDIHLVDLHGNTPDLSNYTALELEEDLKAGKYYVKLSELLEAEQDSNIEVFGYELTD